MKKAKIKITVKSARSNSTADFESDIPSAVKPASPLETLIAAAEHLAILAECHAGAGDEVTAAVAGAVLRVKRNAKAVA